MGSVLDTHGTSPPLALPLLPDWCLGPGRVPVHASGAGIWADHPEDTFPECFLESSRRRSGSQQQTWQNETPDIRFIPTLWVWPRVWPLSCRHRSLVIVSPPKARSSFPFTKFEFTKLILTMLICELTIRNIVHKTRQLKFA